MIPPLHPVEIIVGCVAIIILMLAKFGRYMLAFWGGALILLALIMFPFALDMLWLFGTYAAAIMTLPVLLFFARKQELDEYKNQWNERGEPKIPNTNAGEWLFGDGSAYDERINPNAWKGGKPK